MDLNKCCVVVRDWNMGEFLRDVQLLTASYMFRDNFIHPNLQEIRLGYRQLIDGIYRDSS